MDTSSASSVGRVDDPASPRNVDLRELNTPPFSGNAGESVTVFERARYYLLQGTYGLESPCAGYLSEDAESMDMQQSRKYLHSYLFHYINNMAFPFLAYSDISPLNSPNLGMCLVLYVRDGLLKGSRS